MKMWLMLIKCAAAAGSGCLLFLACADFDIWPLAWVGFIPLFFVLHHVKTARRAFLYGWLSGLAANAGGFYWITHLLMRFGHMHWAPSVVLFLLLAAYQGLHWGLFGYLVFKIRKGSPTIPMTLIAPVVMTTMELIMPFIFPWYLAITQAWIIPVIQIAELTGPLGVTFLLMLANGMVYDLIDWRRANRARLRAEGEPRAGRAAEDRARMNQRFPTRAIVGGAGILVVVLIFGFIRIAQIDTRRAAAPKVKVGVVQGNVGIVEKGRARLAPKHLKLHHQMSWKLEQQGAQLLVWPESSYPYAIERSMTRDWKKGNPFQVMKGIKVPLVFGALTYSREEKHPYNTAFMMTPDGTITGRFDKNYLLVFGEYIPFYEYFPSFKRWFPEASHFNRGTEVTTFPFPFRHQEEDKQGHKKTVDKTYRLGPLICYEDIIPSFGRRLSNFYPHLLVNVTNDAWFGRTSEPWEHMALSVFRTVELRLDLVRAVNTGISVFIDATGRVGKHTQSYDPVATPGVPPKGLLGEVVLMEGGHTVYAALGDWLGYLCLIGVVALVMESRRKVKKRGRSVKNKKKS